jgi:hypothetical protein
MVEEGRPGGKHVHPIFESEDCHVQLIKPCSNETCRGILRAEGLAQYVLQML